MPYRYPLNNLLYAIAAYFTIVVIGPILIISNSHASSDLDETQLLKLKNGEVLVAVQRTNEPSKGLVEATILVDAPAEIIWRIMLNCPEIPTFVPGVKSCEVLESGKNWEIIRHEVEWAWFLPQISYVFRATYKKNRQIDFVRIEGDLQEMRGFWQFTPVAEKDQTIVRYSVFLEPGFYVPRWLIRKMLKSNLPAVLIAVRTKALNSKLDQKL